MKQLKTESAVSKLKIKIGFDELAVLQKAGIRYSVGLGTDYCVIEWPSGEPMPEVAKFIGTMRNADKQI